MDRIAIVDLETRKYANELSPDHEEGWARLRAGDGGASAIVILDLSDSWPYLYDDHSIEAAVRHLESAEHVVGFRSAAFDIPCIEGIIGRRLRLRDHLDLYTLIAHANAARGIVGGKGDFTLDSICRRSLGRGKTGSGASAPELARSGRYAELFAYCMGDVKLTRDLLFQIASTGKVRSPYGSDLYLDVPKWAQNMIPAQVIGEN